ncbi:hypothetical protein BCR34DRAFT_616535 [Clohesyomyces aquaticus]|uniref:Uncharacterized protein n=1 Tax=Clohesyomyces aquaticus TaxID=1231657 RepID=A0A1Y1ZCB7_9PLEO|nr:hypothetical protein BCR34DRAFT_616535 [Clohesyomyces aquaticus]
MLGNASHSMEGLFRASLALDRVNKHNFDPDEAKEFLQQSNLIKRPALHRRIIGRKDDPMDTLEDFLDSRLELEDIVERYAESVHAAMETFMNPHIRIPIMKLSASERMRMMEGFMILKVYYQFKIRFLHAEKFMEAPLSWEPDFLHCLFPWQIAQTLSVESWLQHCGRESSSAFYGLISDRYSSRDTLIQESSYVGKFEEIRGGIWPREIPLRAATMRPWTAVPNGHKPYFQVRPEDSQESMASSPGWVYFQGVGNAAGCDQHTYRRLFEDLGIFFWDLNRLARWRIRDPNQFPEVLELFLERETLARRYHSPMSIAAYDTFNARRLSEDIIEWTRSDVTCPFEAWLDRAYYRRKAWWNLFGTCPRTFPHPPPGFPHPPPGFPPLPHPPIP